MSTPNTKPKKNKLTPVGFRVNDEVYDFLQAKALKPGISFRPKNRTVYDRSSNRSAKKDS
jgi:hypothetical protein